MTTGTAGQVRAGSGGGRQREKGALISVTASPPSRRRSLTARPGLMSERARAVRRRTRTARNGSGGEETAAKDRRQVISGHRRALEADYCHPRDGGDLHRIPIGSFPVNNGLWSSRKRSRQSAAYESFAIWRQSAGLRPKPPAVRPASSYITVFFLSKWVIVSP